MITRDHRAMVLKDEIVNAARQTMFVRKQNPIIDMGNDRLRRFVRCEVFVCV